MARFADYIQRDTRIHGMYLRWSFPPYPVGFVARSVLHGCVQGRDPVTGLPLMQEIVDALTRPLSEEEKHPVVARSPRHPRLLPSAGEADLHRLFLENGWTDGMPIVLPTEELVAEILTGTDHDPEEVIGRMLVTTHNERLEYTVELVAVNAVMAGARPKHLPVILALAEAMAYFKDCGRPAHAVFNLQGLGLHAGGHIGGVVNGLVTLLPRMLAHGEEGHVVSTSSTGGIFAVDGCGLYCAGKFAVAEIMETLAADLKDTPIGALAFIPGPIVSNLGVTPHECRPAHLINDAPPPPPKPSKSME